MSETEQRLLMLIASDAAECRLITALAGREGWRTLLARDPQAAFALLGTRQGMQVDAMIVDEAVLKGNGGDVIAELRCGRPCLPILVLIENGSMLPPAVALRAGASDYLIKPVAPERLMHSLRMTALRASGRDELAPLTEKIPGSLTLETMVGASADFQAAIAAATKAASSQRPMLVDGETGTGKETLVRAIHGAGPRADAPLQIVNVGATPPGSLESVLFGHEKDAFPGAFVRKPGAFQQCDGGTLFIDEIEQMPLFLQQGLLETLKSGKVRPIGSQTSFHTNVRLITASNLPLETLVAGGQFLRELHETISAVTITLPPLRERTSDVTALTHHFLELIGEQPGLRSLGISDSALSLLNAYSWPGNIRQLQGTLLRAAVFCSGDMLTTSDFPQLSARLGGEQTFSARETAPESRGVILYTSDGNLRTLEEIEFDIIRLAIGLYRGRMTEVARRLGIGRSTLYRKLAELGIDNAA